MFRVRCRVKTYAEGKSKGRAWGSKCMQPVLSVASVRGTQMFRCRGVPS